VVKDAGRDKNAAGRNVISRHLFVPGKTFNYVVTHQHYGDQLLNHFVIAGYHMHSVVKERSLRLRVPSEASVPALSIA
jgi:hypothetical protein